MLIYKESVHRTVSTLFLNNLNYWIMSNRTFAQGAILKRIEEKSEWRENFQDYSEHTDYDAYTDYNDCHGDYYDYDK